MSNGNEPVDKLAGDVVAKDASKDAGRPGKKRAGPVNGVPKLLVPAAIVAPIIAAAIIVPLFLLHPWSSGSAAVVTGGSGIQSDYYIEGTILSTAGCTGTFYESAPKPGSTTNTIGKMWLSGGVLHATDEGHPDYTGVLRADGSFHLVWTEATFAGTKSVIDGLIAQDGKKITGTWDTVFDGPCVDHVMITAGHGPSPAQLERQTP